MATGLGALRCGRRPASAPAPSGGSRRGRRPRCPPHPDDEPDPGQCGQVEHQPQRTAAMERIGRAGTKRRTESAIQVRTGTPQDDHARRRPGRTRTTCRRSPSSLELGHRKRGRGNGDQDATTTVIRTGASRVLVIASPRGSDRHAPSRTSPRQAEHQDHHHRGETGQCADRDDLGRPVDAVDGDRGGEVRVAVTRVRAARCSSPSGTARSTPRRRGR